MIFKDNLKIILNDMSKYHRDKDTLNQLYIEDRLQKSLESYYHELNKSIDYLNTKDQLKLLKKINKGGI